MFELWPTSASWDSLDPTASRFARSGLALLALHQLAYTSGRGNIVPDAVADSPAAQRPTARARAEDLLLGNTDIRSTTREWGFIERSRKLQAVGIASKIEAACFPQINRMLRVSPLAQRTSIGHRAAAPFPRRICEHLTAAAACCTKGPADSLDRVPPLLRRWRKCTC